MYFGNGVQQLEMLESPKGRRKAKVGREGASHKLLRHVGEGSEAISDTKADGQGIGNETLSPLWVLKPR
jgi:hypothetical protein